MGRSWNLTLDVICGALFGIGWWVFVDGIANVDVLYGQTGKFYLYAPGVLATIGIFLICNLPNSIFKKDSFEETTWVHKLVIAIGSACHLASIIEAVWTFVAKKESSKNADFRWRGVSMIVQSVLIALASFMWQFLYTDPNS